MPCNEFLKRNAGNRIAGIKKNTGNDLSILSMEYRSAQATTKSCPMAITPSTTILTNWGLQLENL